MTNPELERLAERNQWLVANCAEEDCGRAISRSAPRETGHHLEGRIMDRPYCTRDMRVTHRRRCR